MIAALTDTEVQVAIVSTVGTILVASIGAAVAWLGRQNTNQHNAAAAERAVDRQAQLEYRKSLDQRLQNMHDDVTTLRDVVVDHVTDRSVHGG